MWSKWRLASPVDKADVTTSQWLDFTYDLLYGVLPLFLSAIAWDRYCGAKLSGAQVTAPDEQPLHLRITHPRFDPAARRLAAGWLGASSCLARRPCFF